MIRRVLPFILSLLLCAGLLPGACLAEENMTMYVARADTCGADKPAFPACVKNPFRRASGDAL